MSRKAHLFPMEASSWKRASLQRKRKRTYMTWEPDKADFKSQFRESLAVHLLASYLRVLPYSSDEIIHVINKRIWGKLQPSKSKPWLPWQPMGTRQVEKLSALHFFSRSEGAMPKMVCCCCYHCYNEFPMPGRKAYDRHTQKSKVVKEVNKTSIIRGIWGLKTGIQSKE